jgi:hypothetical protein
MTVDPFVESASTLLDAPPLETCRVCWHLPRLSNERRDALNALLSSKIGNKTIAHLCKDNSIPLSRDAIGTHRAAGHSA